MLFNFNQVMAQFTVWIKLLLDVLHALSREVLLAFDVFGVFLAGHYARIERI